MRRYQNKLKAHRMAYIDRKKKGSQRRRRSIRVKQKQLKKVAHQLRDALHKLTSKLVSTLHKQGLQTVVIGDIRTIRKTTDHGHVANQRLHQMPSGIVRRMLTYKAERLGMHVVLVSERYTTQTCPACGFLERFTGEYAVFGMPLTVALKGDNTLMVSLPGQQDYELVPHKGTEFSLKGLSAYSIEFKSDPSGAVTEARLTQPGGVFTARKQ